MELGRFFNFFFDMLYDLWCVLNGIAFRVFSWEVSYGMILIAMLFVVAIVNTFWKGAKV